jgi:serine/threonine protein kinase
MQLIKELHSHSVSHGDLHHENIIVQKNGDIQLIDYDSICIPSLEGKSEFINGKGGYQHPSRFTSSQCTIKADYFSELVIYLSVLAIAENPALWIAYNIADTEYFLFSPADLAEFDKSKIKKDLLLLSPKIQGLVLILEDYLKEKNYLGLVPFDKYLKQPKIIRFDFDPKYHEIIEGEEVIFEWETQDAKEVSINGIGIVSFTGFCKQSITKTGIFQLEAKGYFGQVKSDPVSIEVYPLPVIVKFKPGKEKIEKGKETFIEWEVTNAKRIFLNGKDVTDSTGKGKILVTPDETTEYILEVHSFKSRKKISQARKVKVFSPVKLKHFSSDRPFTIESKPVILSWDAVYADKVMIEPGIGDVSGLSEKQVFPTKSTTYILTVSNELYKERSQPVEVKVLPLPKLSSVPYTRVPDIDTSVLPAINIDIADITSTLEKSLLPVLKTNPGFSFIRLVSEITESLRKHIIVSNTSIKNKTLIK